MCWIHFSALSRKPRRTSLTEFSLSPSHTELAHTHTHTHDARQTRKHVRFALPPDPGHKPLHGYGAKRAAAPPPPPPPPPPSPRSPRNRGAEWAPRGEGRYRTVVAVPGRGRERERERERERFAVRAATSRRLEEVRVEAFRPSEVGRRLRRVAGYEVLSRRVPWGWECVEMETDEPRGRGGRYPPFGGAETWM